MTAGFLRVGAIVSAVTLFGATVGTIAEGARAQDQGVGDQPQMIEETPSEDAAADEVRFVASPVVQDIGDDAAPAIALPPVDVSNLRELVAQTEIDDTLSGDIKCLAQAIYFESRGEPLAGQLAVARVVINRAESAAFPDSYCSVVKQRAQFSFVRGGRIPEPNRSSAAWQRAKAIAHIAESEMWASDADDALYFHATRVNPRWARTKVARATIDSHIFYR
ncbi:cell wall hydrolase [Aurantiacibacter suaedae]|uniref:cell wall hydrolase n=1 Tax=Aurantiacibacter suaedae TaxID=2545755 RepID=UPI001F4F378F|nr:cell wall hydrolase [Aurantiacibacter suaedae]